MKTLGAIVDGTDPKETQTEGLRKYFFYFIEVFCFSCRFFFRKIFIFQALTRYILKQLKLKLTMYMAWSKCP